MAESMASRTGGTVVIDVIDAGPSGESSERLATNKLAVVIGELLDTSEMGRTASFCRTGNRPVIGSCTLTGSTTGPMGGNTPKMGKGNGFLFSPALGKTTAGCR